MNTIRLELVGSCLYPDDDRNRPIREFVIYREAKEILCTITSDVMVRTLEKRLLGSVTFSFPREAQGDVFIEGDRLFTSSEAAGIRTVRDPKVRDRHSANLHIEERITLGLIKENLEFTMTTRMPAYEKYMKDAKATYGELASLSSKAAGYDDGTLLRRTSALMTRLLEFDRLRDETAQLKDEDIIRRIRDANRIESCIEISPAC